MNERLTDEEWSKLKDSFPSMKRDDVRKTGEKTAVYNCYAFTLGITTSRVLPRIPADVANFLEMYAERGVAECSENVATIDGWCRVDRYTHASVGTPESQRWESKLGDYIRITHPRDDLIGETYGVVKKWLRPTNRGSTAPLTISVPSHTGSGSQPSGSHLAQMPPSAASHTSITVAALSPSAPVNATLASLVAALTEGFPHLSTSFESSFKGWKDTWFAEESLFSQSLEDLAHGPHWDTLVALSDKILPYVVDKLRVLPENQTAVELYDKLQSESAMKVSPDDWVNYYVLVNRAVAIVNLYGDFVNKYNALASAWKAHVKSVNMSSSTSSYIDTPTFRALAALPAAQTVPLVMADYSKDQSGWWHELLYQLEHGRGSSATTIVKVQEYQKWKTWFEGSSSSAQPPTA